MKLQARLLLMGAVSVFCTVLMLVLLSAWQGRVFKARAVWEAKKLVDADLNHTAAGIYRLVRSQDDSIRQEVDHNLAVAHQELNRAGGVTLSPDKVAWTAVNQFSRQKRSALLPKMLLGGTGLQRNTAPTVPTPVVDTVQNLVGGTETIFQRMDEAGDMLRVATNVQTLAGKRAVGTYIPAVGPDGKPNAVAAAVRKGQTYRGAAYVVNDWYDTAYEPIFDSRRQVIGALYVGVKQESVAALRQGILDTTVGKTGYVFALKGQGEARGHCLISREATQNGKNLWDAKDARGLPYIQSLIRLGTTLQPEQIATTRYLWKPPGQTKARWRVVRVLYYAPWDWVIGVGADEDDFRGFESNLQEGQSLMLQYMAVAGLCLGALGVFFFRLWSRQVSTQEAKERLLKTNSALENAVEGISQLDVSGHYVSVNAAYAAAVGYAPEEMLGMFWETTVHPEDRPRLREAFEKMCREGKADAEAQGVRKDGSLFHKQVTLIAAYDEAENRAGNYCFMKDISERRALEARISHQAFHDALSGLPNRLFFLERVAYALAQARHRKDSVAVMFLDLDNFKVVNDSLGHEEGDRLLIAVARRLQDSVRPGDTVARIGGDEFTVLLENIACAEDVVLIAERIVERLREPIRLATREIFVTTSIGIALSHHASEETESLLRDADTAMYQAKLSGKAGYVLFDRSMNDRVVERLELETGLHRALEQDEFRVLYQPILNMESGQIVGAEALVRWEHPKLGLVAPAKFIPLAEETGLIVPLGAWVLGEACRQAKTWQERHGADRPFVISVNLSGRQLQSPGLVEMVTVTLRETGLDPARLKLEITESVMMEDIDATIGTLNALKAVGVQLAVDDFGTGYSSLSYLQRLPVDTVKIDRSFISLMEDAAQPAAIVQTIILLCRALKLNVTGEGIETPDQLAQLQTLGCQTGQGYYFSEPVDSAAFDVLLTSGVAGLRVPQALTEELAELALQSSVPYREDSDRLALL